jgi:hypothetical protein
MKNFIYILIISALSGAVHAQTIIKAGTIQLGGNVGYAHTSQETPVNNGTSNPNKQTTINNQFTIAPSVGFFVADNLAVGVSGAYQISQTKYKQPQNILSYDEKMKQFRIGAFVQYYKMVTEQFGFTGTLDGGYQREDRPYNYGLDKVRTNGAYANLTPSIVFFPIPKLAIGASIGGLSYLYASQKDLVGATSPNTYDTSSFAASFGLSQLLFSGTYYFGR